MGGRDCRTLQRQWTLSRRLNGWQKLGYSRDGGGSVGG